MPGETGAASAASAASTAATSVAATSGALYGKGRGGGKLNSGCAAVGAISLVIIGILLLIVLNGRTPTSGNDATVTADLSIMHSALGSKIVGWQAGSDTTVHHVSTAESGLPANFNTKEVVYGHCSSGGFYLFVLNADPGTGLNGSADSSGYVYTPKNIPANCTPTGWVVTGSRDVGSEWYYVNIDSKAATANPTR